MIARLLGTLTVALLIGSCAAPRDVQHHIVVSTKEQRLALLDHETLVAIYPISTSKFGLGDWPGSMRTPLGEMEVASKIGDGAVPGAVFKDRHRTGEVIAPDAPGRDPIVTRIIWLRGRETRNANAFRRNIYIHGTPEERNIGRPASYGCVRMRSTDVIKLYEAVGNGAVVTITDASLGAIVPGMSSASSLSPENHGGMVIR